MRIAGMMAAILAATGLCLAPAMAQIRTIDPNRAGAPATAATPPADQPADTAAAPDVPQSPSDAPAAEGDPARQGDRPAPVDETRRRAAAVAGNDTYAEKDVLQAAEGTFGKGAEGLGKMIEGIFKKQGRPIGYIAGREAGGAIIAGVRYGSGTLFHRIEGERKVYWTGPSIGFDLGANGAKTFVLIYNLYDSQDLYHRFPAAEGNLYVVGGFTASYLRRGDVVVIPIRLGVGWRAGVNLGYMRFTETSRWSPF